MEANLFFRHARSKRTGLIKAATILILLSLIAQPVFAHNANPNVAPPNSKPYGKSYGEWSAEWWRYVVGLPAEDHPLLSTTGENCGYGQSGPVFFLMGTIGSTATRNDCVVPAGKAILFPIINFFCAAPEDGLTAQDIRGLCHDVTNHVDDLRVTVDDIPLENLQAYRFEQFFSFDGAIDNPYDTYCGIAPECYEGYHETGYSDGYWIMLHPLTPGDHEINFYGHMSYPDWGWVFGVEVTYNIIVKK